MTLEVVSTPQITPEIKAWADEKAQHTREYVSPALAERRSATQIRVELSFVSITMMTRSNHGVPLCIFTDPL